MHNWGLHIDAMKGQANNLPYISVSLHHFGNFSHIIRKLDYDDHKTARLFMKTYRRLGYKIFKDGKEYR